MFIKLELPRDNRDLDDDLSRPAFLVCDSLQRWSTYLAIVDIGFFSFLYITEYPCLYPRQVFIIIANFSHSNFFVLSQAIPQVQPQ